MEKIILVYMVAGISSRFKGGIKQFAKIGPQGETLIEYSLKQALPAGFNKIIFIVGNLTEKPFKKMFGNQYKGIPIEYALQKYDPAKRNKPWGTLDSICQIKDIVKSPFVVCNGDDLYGEQSFKILTNHLREKRTNATLGYDILKVLPEKGYVNRGVFELKENKVLSIKEILNISKENLFSKGLNENTTASMNIFAFQPEILDNLNKRLIKFKEQNKGDKEIECFLSTELNNSIKKEGLIIKLYPTPDKWVGITNPEDESKVKEIIQNNQKISL